MARSMTGGTRGFIRGKVANDLYQVTKNADGRKIQLVRAVEEQRINNNTLMQAVSRMQMALCMGCLSQFKEIVDHSFEGIPYGQLSIAHFVKLNIPRIQADCREHWEYDNRFSYPEKGVSRVRIGEFILSSGTLVLPDFIAISYYPGRDATAAIRIQLDADVVTMGDLKRKLGLAAQDYITGLVIVSDDADGRYSRFIYRRAYLSQIDDDVVLTEGSVSRFFSLEGTAVGDIMYDDAAHQIFIEIYDDYSADARQWVMSDLIVSRWSGQVWQRNNSTFRLNPEIEVNDYVKSPSDVFQSWYESYDPDNPYNPYG